MVEDTGGSWRLSRRQILHGIGGIALLPTLSLHSPAVRRAAQENAGPAAGAAAPEAARTIVMVHGVAAGGWCFDPFRAVFEGLGWACHTLDLRYHGADAAEAPHLAGIGIADYRTDLAAYLRTFATPPVLLGHSMGAVLAQQLAALGLARALILVSPAPRAGILPVTASEKQVAQSLMTLGPFWTTIIHPDFAAAVQQALNRVPPDRQRQVFDRFGPESGRVLFEVFFWMLDPETATAVDTDAVRCPVLCVSGTEDRLISLETARATVAPFRNATFWEATGHGHMLPVEPGAEDIARRIAAWSPT